MKNNSRMLLDKLKPTAPFLVSRGMVTDTDISIQGSLWIKYGKNRMEVRFAGYNQEMPAQASELAHLETEVISSVQYLDNGDIKHDWWVMTEKEWDSVNKLVLKFINNELNV